MDIVEKDLGMLAVNRLDMSCQGTQLARKVSSILACVRNTEASRTKEEIVALYC